MKFPVAVTLFSCDDSAIYYMETRLFWDQNVTLHKKLSMLVILCVLTSSSLLSVFMFIYCYCVDRF